MRLPSRPCFLLGLLLSLASAAHAARTPLVPRHAKQQAAVGKAVYFITNENTNAVVALPIAADGKLSPGTVTPTGGSGAVTLNSNKQPATPDALVSQGALTIAGNTIFAVNAGSNTLSMLSISPSNPTNLTLIGNPVAVPGDFPNTVGASAKHNLVCVGTTGARAGVACSRFSKDRGLEPMDELRPFDLGQTTPPVGPTNTVSHVFFSGDEGMVFATVKGDPAVNKTGVFAAFSVEKQGQQPGSCLSARKSRRGMAAGKKTHGTAVVSRQAKRSTPEGTAVLFGSQAIPNTNTVFATDAAFGAVVLAVDPVTGQAVTVGKGTVDGQVATCWATISPVTGTAFVTDIKVNRLVEMSLKDASVLSEVDLSANGDLGLIDLRAAGGFIYALSPGNGTAAAAISVVEVSGGPGSAKPVQHFELSGLAGSKAMGIAVLN